MVDKAKAPAQRAELAEGGAWRGDAEGATFDLRDYRALAEAGARSSEADAGLPFRPTALQRELQAWTDPGVQVAQPRAVQETLVQVNEDGFGDPQAAYTWAMKVFNGQLYASTLHLDGTQPFSTGIFGRAALHRYDGQDWDVVMDDGFGVSTNDGIRNLQEYNGYLYAATLNEWKGGELWRSADGDSWEQVVSGGFGDKQNLAIRGLTEYQGMLYATTQSKSAPAEMWRSADGATWEQVVSYGFGDPNNSSIHTMLEFDGVLYATTRNTETGAQLWKSTDGDNWQVEIKSGFLNQNNTVIFHMIEFQGEMYLSTGNSVDGFGVYRTPDGDTFERVGEAGFGDPDNVFGWRFHIFDEALYLGTASPNLENGASLWRSFDGDTWEQLVGDNGTLAGPGFDNPDNWGVRSFETYEDELYIGTANYPYYGRGRDISGAEVYRLEQTELAPAAVEPPAEDEFLF